MYVDKQNEFADSQVVTGTAISTNVIDLGATNTLKDIGSGQNVYLIVQVDAAATAAGAATVTFSLESDSTENLATSATVHYTSTAIGKAALTAGSTQLAIKLPAGSYERYLGVRYTVATGPLLTGSFSAFLTTDAQTWRPYARNYVA